eukprot:2875712-Rhodomonas_salina.4
MCIRDSPPSPSLPLRHSSVPPPLRSLTCRHLAAANGRRYTVPAPLPSYEPFLRTCSYLPTHLPLPPYASSPYCLRIRLPFLPTPLLRTPYASSPFSLRLFPTLPTSPPRTPYAPATACPVLKRQGPTKVRALLHAGADANAMEEAEGRTALFLAAQSGHLAILKLLLMHGADVYLANHHGEDPLASAQDRFLHSRWAIPLRARSALSGSKLAYDLPVSLCTRYTVCSPRTTPCAVLSFSNSARPPPPLCAVHISAHGVRYCGSVQYCESTRNLSAGWLHTLSEKGLDASPVRDTCYSHTLCYAMPKRCPVLRGATCLRACYAMSGTNLAYGATPGFYQGGRKAQEASRSATLAACALATRCPVLIQCMLSYQPTRVRY